MIEIGSMTYLAEVFSCVAQPPAYTIVIDVEHAFDLQDIGRFWRRPPFQRLQ